jgi:transposase
MPPIRLPGKRNFRPWRLVTAVGARVPDLLGCCLKRAVFRCRSVMAFLRVSRRRGARFSSTAIRTHLRSHGIKATIPEPADQVKNRLKRGSRGGRPPAFDAAAYKQRNVVERAFCQLRQYRAVATRYDKRDYVWREPSTWPRSGSGSAIPVDELRGTL